MKNMAAIRDQNVTLNANNKNTPKNLVVYSKSNEKNILDLEKEYGEKLDSKCREILRDFNGLLNKNPNEYEKRKMAEASYSDEIDNEILKL